MSATTQPTGETAAVSAKTEIRVYAHSNLIYWWPVWLWGYCCALMTWGWGVGVHELASTSEKVILFYPEPWLGLSYLLVTLSVLTISNVRMRGLGSLLVPLALAIIVFELPKVPGMERVIYWLGFLRIHLNLAFYITCSTLLLALWVASILGEHCIWYRFAPGQMAVEHLLKLGTGRAYLTEGMMVQRLPDDLFRHKILGCQWFGLGTGDLIVVTANKEAFELHNVVRANARQKIIQDLAAMKSTV